MRGILFLCTILGVLNAAAQTPVPTQTFKSLFDLHQDRETPLSQPLPGFSEGLPDGVEVFLWDEGRVQSGMTGDGIDFKWKGFIHIEHSGEGTVSIPLVAFDDPGYENTAIWYKADWMVYKTPKRAYLEMLCTFPDGKTYFSRGLDRPLSQSNGAFQQIPFFLKAGERPTRVTIGVGMDGPGTVKFMSMELSKEKQQVNLFKPSGWLHPGAVGGILGTLYGFWGAAIGCVGGYCTPRGKCKRLVMGLYIGMIICSIVCLILGIVFLLSASTYAITGWAFLYCGALGGILGGTLMPMTMRQYAEVELRRMRAKDVTDFNA
ncbi:MAG: hypothetical protein GC154_19525 [bacterium]|nr:hypothetical protein [bacterium]